MTLALINLSLRIYCEKYFQHHDWIMALSVAIPLALAVQDELLIVEKLRLKNDYVKCAVSNIY